MSLPHYYTSLGPFLQTFTAGRPILMYHHVATHPRGARIKGLYVKPRLFARQLNELKRSGFLTEDMGSFAGNESLEKRVVWLTFDDGFVDVFQNALPEL